MSTQPNTTSKSSVRRRQFEECLYELLLKMPYHQISISHLCQQVGSSRRTFYRHFRDKDACLCSIFKRCFQSSLLNIAERFNHTVSDLELASAMMESWRDQRDIAEIILKNNLSHLFLHQGVLFINEEESSLLQILGTPEMKADNDILIFFLGGLLSMALQWHLRDYDTPPEEMAKKYLRLLYQPIVRLPDSPN